MAQELKSNDNQSASLLAGKVLILDGPPASGKGSIAQYLCKQYNCIHVSTGDLFREHVKNNTELGKQVKQYFDKKSFVPDQLVVNHVLDRISQPDAKQYGCVLDGFPRTPAQFTALKNANITVDRAIKIQCPDSVLLERAKGRRIDSNTGNIYHIEYVPPPKDIKVNLVKRDMDENIQRRLDVFHAQHRRFTLDKCVKINGNKPIKEVFADVIRILRHDQSVENDGDNAQEVEVDASAAQVKASDCSICLDRPSDFIVIPCGHQCGCEACLKQLKANGQKCPICRGTIQSVTKVYASHTVTVKSKKKEAAMGVPEMQQIVDKEEQIFEEKKDDAAWPEDAPDDDEKKDANNENKSGISVRIAPANVIQNDIQNVVLELNVGDKPRCAVDVCCVLDVSGSMCSSAAVQEDDGSVKKDDGLSVLDLVKHSVRTVINCLSANDRLSIVKFSSDAEVQYPLSYMTQTGIGNAVQKLNQLQPGGTTNLWEGLRVGMESLRTKQTQNRLSVIMLLTDGRPTIIPPKGEIHELQKYIDRTDFAAQINTFGFGYDLDSELLHSLAVFGGGTFAFIPDSNIVGTTFVNSISNVLTTVTAETKLHLTAVNGAKFSGKAWGAHNVNEESWGRVVQMGPMLCESTRFISIPMSIPKSDKPYLECVLSTGVLGVRGKFDKTEFIGKERAINNELLAGHLTAKAVSTGLEACELCVKRKGNAALNLLKALKSEVEIAAEIAKKDETDNFNQMTANSRVDALNADVNGRLNKAFQGQTRFNRWGKHYIRALLRAHQLNVCTNFMDPGLQVNGGHLFRQLRAKGDEVFINLPPPKPSRRTGPTRPQNNQSWWNNVVPQNNNRNAAPPQQVYRAPSPPSVNMADYYGGSGGGCFGGQSLVKVLGFGQKCVSDVTVGDMVEIIGGFAKVLFVVELARDKQKRMMQLPGGLVITGGHPVRRGGLWCLPRECKDGIEVDGCESVFTFVLESGHVMVVNGMECVTWGHGMSESVVRHDFFGNLENVIGALRGKMMNMGQRVNGDLLNNVIGIYGCQ